MPARAAITPRRGARAYARLSIYFETGTHLPDLTA